MTPREALKKYFGYDEFRPGQEAVICHVLSGRDALVIMPTGGGKSLCFQLPALMLDGVTLVISPLISLMKDQVDALNSAGVAAAFINSTLPPNEIANVQSAAISGQLKILYVAPERLAMASFTAFLRRLRLSLIVVDEAHCISEWGHDFRPDYRNLRPLRQQFPSVPVLALTATATENVRRDIAVQLGLAGGRIFISSFDRPNLSYAIWPKKHSLPRLVGLLKERPEQSVIVYCASRKTTESVAQSLCGHGIEARAYHAGLEPAERSRVQEMFVRDDISVVVATIAFGMGIDKPDVRLVVHYDLPKTIEGYYQETGRAGRDGLPSECVLFFSYGDRQKHLYLINQTADPDERAKAREKLWKVVRFCEYADCRRKYLLGYFGERYGRDGCGACDVCVPELRAAPMPEAVAKVVKSGGAGKQGLPGTRAERVVQGSGGVRRAAFDRSDVDAALFEKLRKLRKRIADERNVPAFVVFGDRTLLEMAATRPTDRTALAGVFGIGAKKLEVFGDAFLEVIRAHVSEAMMD